jgi:hypothetical protein
MTLNLRIHGIKDMSFFSLYKPDTQVLRSQKKSQQICSNKCFINSKRQYKVMVTGGAVFTQNYQKAVKTCAIQLMGS